MINRPCGVDNEVMEFAYAFDQKMSTQTNGCFEEMLSAEHVSPSEHEASS